MTGKHQALALNSSAHKSHWPCIYFGYLSLPFYKYFINVLILFIFVFFRSNTDFATVQFLHFWIHSKPTPTSHNVSKSFSSLQFKVMTQRDVFETQKPKIWIDMNYIGSIIRCAAFAFRHFKAILWILLSKINIDDGPSSKRFRFRNLTRIFKNLGVDLTKLPKRIPKFENRSPIRI